MGGAYPLPPVRVDRRPCGFLHVRTPTVLCTHPVSRTASAMTIPLSYKSKCKPCKEYAYPVYKHCHPHEYHHGAHGYYDSHYHAHHPHDAYHPHDEYAYYGYPHGYAYGHTHGHYHAPSYEYGHCPKAYAGHYVASKCPKAKPCSKTLAPCKPKSYAITTRQTIVHAATPRVCITLPSRTPTTTTTMRRTNTHPMRTNLRPRIHMNGRITRSRAAPRRVHRAVSRHVRRSARVLRRA